MSQLSTDPPNALEGVSVIDQGNCRSNFPSRQAVSRGMILRYFQLKLFHYHTDPAIASKLLYNFPKKFQ